MVTIYDQTIAEVIGISWLNGVVSMRLKEGLFVWDRKTGALVCRQNRDFADGLVKRCEAFHGVAFTHTIAKDGLEPWTKP